MQQDLTPSSIAERSPDEQATSGLRGLFWWFLIFFLLATVLAISLLADKSRRHSTDCAPTPFASHASAATDAVAGTRDESAASGGAPVKGENAELKRISEALNEVLCSLHPAPKLPEAILQICAVLAMSLQWLFAFMIRSHLRHSSEERLERGKEEHKQKQQLKQAQKDQDADLRVDDDEEEEEEEKGVVQEAKDEKWGKEKYSVFDLGLVIVALSFAPAVLFVGAMYQAYQPAVLVMALVAIVVAAEHLSGLEMQKEDLRRQTTALKGQTNMLTEAIATLEKNKEDTGRLLADAGLNKFVDLVYREYRHAERISAVFRVLNIDDFWWSSAKAALQPPIRPTTPHVQATLHGQRVAGGTPPARRDPWKRYFRKARERAGKPGGGSALLAEALASTEDRKKLVATFVADLPVPGSREWIARIADSSEPLFGDLLGLAWQLNVLEHVQVEGQTNLELWVSRPLSWIHATDKIAFQVLRREPKSHSALLVIADCSNPEHMTEAEKDAHARILEWAHDDIRRYVERGTRAQEYLFSALRFAALVGSKRETAELVRYDRSEENLPLARPTPDLRDLLVILGAEVWLRSTEKVSKLSAFKPHDLLDLAGGVFARLIDKHFGSVQPPHDIEKMKTASIEVRALWNELL